MKRSPLKQESEDAYIINENMHIYGVCDGATPIIPFQDKNGHNGAFLAANLFKQYFETIQEEDSLAAHIMQANQRLREAMLDHRVDVTNKQQLWCTCIAVIRITENNLMFAQLGDSMIVVRYKDGSIRVLTKDTVKGIGERARLKRREERGRGFIVPDESVFADRKQQILYNRTLANTPNGYTVANGSIEAGQFIQHGIEAIDTIKNILICSDGLFHPVLSLEEVAHAVWTNGLEQYVENLGDFEYKRGLHPDDKTAVVISL
ncbi:protein phosphatase 2C domain-containing protein [Bacillus sp. 165]|uniref:protein phosphatase 2C domain-containing protein n=1 Tax=Bacillus sp. 165 TaxID=1529117 RepID=UPI001ADB38A4|nr:protein phosphatase 2C domain-containing protein [Bacillus sp. 165]MBO9129035.1 protein phosphatase 2C domain-containing protein [Bacillus sp. 165]